MLFIILLNVIHVNSNALLLPDSITHKQSIERLNCEFELFESAEGNVDAHYILNENFESQNDQIEILDMDVSHLTLEESINLVKTDYWEYLRVFPHDTVGGVLLLVDELDAYINIDSTRRDRIYSTIMFNLKKGNLNKFKKTETSINFLKKDIYPLLESLLTVEEMKIYTEKRSQRRILHREASRLIHNEIYYDDSGEPRQHMEYKKAYRKLVFGD